MLDRLEFLFSEAFVAPRRNSWMTFAAITTPAVALFLLGSLGIAYVGINRYAQSLPSRFSMEVFLKDGTTVQQVKETAPRLRAIPGVESAVWIPRDLFWEQERKKYPPAVTEGIENPLPHKFKVRLKDIGRAEEVAAAIRMVPTVDPQNVLFESDEQRLLTDILSLLRVFGLGAGGLLLVAGGVLIYNTIRLTVVARRREIRIMQLVGATRATVIVPLLIEGVLQGVLGGLVASALIVAAHRVLERLVESLTALGRIEPLPVGVVVGGSLAAGALYGLTCSLLAVRDPRRLGA